MTFVWSQFSFFLTDWTGGRRRKGEITQEIRGKQWLLDLSCEALRTQRDAPGTTEEQKKQLNADIAHMQRLFAEDIKESFRRGRDA